MSQEDFFLRLLIAIGIGLIIGLEREYISLRTQAESFAGVRTFVFFTITGFVSAFLALMFSEIILTLGFFSVIVIVGISYWMTAKNGNIGGTTEMTAILTFLLGVVVALGFITESLGITVVVVTFLSLKGKFQSFAGKISQQEIYAFAIFTALAILVIPFMPDKSLGPYGVVNPKEIGWIVLLTSGLGFIGYILMKFFGTDKGILLTGIIGGVDLQYGSDLGIFQKK